MCSSDLTASQLNRSSINAVVKDHSHIGGGISKIHVADVYFSVKMDDIETNQNRVIFSLQKTRNSDGVGQNIFLNYNPRRLLMSDNESQPLEFNKKEPQNDEIITGLKLGGLLSLNNP